MVTERLFGKYQVLFLLMTVQLAYSDIPLELTICTQRHHQTYPAISGDIVVWQETRGEPATNNVYGYDLSTSTEFIICDILDFQIKPEISGDIVVWQDQRNGNADIYGYDLGSSTEFPICVNDANQLLVAISGDIVVWEDYRNGNSDIYGYDLSTSTEFPICTDAASQTVPAVSGDIVAWQDDRNGNGDIYGYDIGTSTEFPVCTDPAVQTVPSISGDIVVWRDYRNGGNTDIYGYDLSATSEFPVYTNTEKLSAPSISGNIVVWLQGYVDIYGRNLVTGDTFPICTETDIQSGPIIDGDIVVWHDKRDGNYDIYGFDFSGIDWPRVSNSSDLCSSVYDVIEGTTYDGTTYLSSGTDISSCGPNDIYDVWNRYVPIEDGTVTISTNGSDFDTVLSVYDDCGGVELACNDNREPGSTQSEIVMDVNDIETYYIRIAGVNKQVGNYDLLVKRGYCSNKPKGDVNGDCMVDLLDFAVMTSEWLYCGWSDPNNCF